MAAKLFTGENKHLGQIDVRDNGEVAVNIDCYFAGHENVAQVLKTEGDEASVVLKPSDEENGNCSQNVVLSGSVGNVAKYLAKHYEGDTDNAGILADLERATAA